MHTFGRCWGASSYILTLYLQHCFLGSSPRAKQEAQRCIVKAGQTGNDGEPVQKAKVPAHYQNHLQPKIMGQREGTVRRDDAAVFQHQLKSWKTCFFFLKKWTTQWALTKWRAAPIPQNPTLFFVFTSCRLPGSLPQAIHEAQIQFKCTVMDKIAKCN